MKQNKGVIGVGLVLAIVLGIVVVGGGAYYLGTRDPHIYDGNWDTMRDEYNKKQIDNSQNPVAENQEEENIQSDCTPSSTPSIKVLSPNGGELYRGGDKINIKWSSCNLARSTHLRASLARQAPLPDGEYPIPILFGSTEEGRISTSLNDGEQLVNLDSTHDVVPASYKLCINEYSTAPGQNIIGDCSDNSFSVGFATGMPDPKSLTLLPENYIGSKNWPPVITTSSKSYSCNNIGIVPNTEGNSINEQRVINGKKYCIISNSDHAMSHTYTDYTYTTANGNGTKIASFNLSSVSCGVYGRPGITEYDVCQTTISTFLNNLDVIVDRLMQAK